MLKKLIIYGAGNPTILKNIAAINQATNQWQIAGFLVDKEFDPEPEYYGYPILGGRETIPSLVNDQTYFVNNINSTTPARKLTCDILDNHNCQLATLIHPLVETEFTDIGEGTVIYSGVALGANVTIGRHCSALSNVVIGHDSSISDHSILTAASTLCGYVTLGKCVYLGANCTIRHRITVNDNSTVGAGAVVINNVKPNVVVAGVPAQELRPKSFAENG